MATATEKRRDQVLPDRDCDSPLPIDTIRYVDPGKLPGPVSSQYGAKWDMGPAAKFGNVHVPMKIVDDWQAVRQAMVTTARGRKYLAVCESDESRPTFVYPVNRYDSTFLPSRNGKAGLPRKPSLRIVTGRAFRKEAALMWDPRSAAALADGSAHPPFLIAVHELGHAARRTSCGHAAAGLHRPRPEYTNDEEYAVIENLEREVAQVHGFHARDGHIGAGFYKTAAVNSIVPMYADDAGLLQRYASLLSEQTAMIREHAHDERMNQGAPSFATTGRQLRSLRDGQALQQARELRKLAGTRRASTD